MPEATPTNIGQNGCNSIAKSSRTNTSFHQQLPPLQEHLGAELTCPQPPPSVFPCALMNIRDKETTDAQVPVPVSAPASANVSAACTKTQTGKSLPPVKFPMLDGIRVIFTVYIISFHTLWYNTFHMSPDQYLSIASIPSLRFVSMGINGVDVFFVMTGFLLAYPVFTSGKIGHWGDYVWHRISRLYPSMFAISAFILFILYNILVEYLFGLSSKLGNTSFWFLAPFTWTFLANLVPFGGFMGHTWSICVQVHFYLLFPWLITKFGTGKSLMKVILSAFAISLPVRYLIPKVLLTFIGLPRYLTCDMQQLSTFIVYFNIYYAPTYFRIFSILAGVVLAWVMVFEVQWVETIRKSFFYQILLLIVALPGVYYSYSPLDENAWKFVFFYPSGCLWLLSLTILFFLTLTRQPIFTPITYFFSLPIFSVLAPATYGAYLVHCAFVSRFIEWGIHPPLFTFTWSSFIVYLSRNTICAFIIGFLVEKYVERPGVKWLKSIDTCTNEKEWKYSTYNIVAKVKTLIYDIRMYTKQCDAIHAEKQVRKIVSKILGLNWSTDKSSIEREKHTSTLSSKPRKQA